MVKIKIAIISALILAGASTIGTLVGRVALHQPQVAETVTKLSSEVKGFDIVLDEKTDETAAETKPNN